MDLNNDLAGYSGEKLSGGQRQVVNIISGLVNPSKILILDEPTNALDQELKVELLEVIKEFKSNKQAILIISHDSDVFKIFSFGPPKGSLPEKNLAWGTKGKF